MNRQEQIIKATIQLAAQKGLGEVSMSMIADAIGIKKPSLYNHFVSKEEIVEQMFLYIEDEIKDRFWDTKVNYSEYIEGKSTFGILTEVISNYILISQDKVLYTYIQVLYSERAVNITAARIMAEETERMLVCSKKLFTAMQVKGLIHVHDINVTATSFAMTVRSLIDYSKDCQNSGKGDAQTMLQDYIIWFEEQLQ